MLELINVSKIYKTKSEDVHALNKVNLYFPNKGLVFVTGKSGSGKTTLLNVIGGLDDFSEGEIIIKDKSTKDFTKADYDSYRNTFLGFVFQEYNLLDNMTIAKNISLATELQGLKDNPKRVEEILKEVDLVDIGNRKPQELSGGQRQRVAIARAIIKNPDIILADEPTGALDTANGIQVINLLKKLSKTKLVIVVSHNLELANQYADRIIELEDGNVKSDITIDIEKRKHRNIKSNKEVVSIKRGADLKEKDLLEIKDAVKKGKSIQVIDNINIIKKKTKVDRDNIDYKTNPFIKTKMKFWDTIKLGLAAFKGKTMRLVVTILLSALAFSVFGMFDAMSIFDENRLTTNTLKSAITPSVTLTTVVKEDGDSYDIKAGDSIINSLAGQTKYSIKGVYDSYFVGKNPTPREMSNNTKDYNISKYYYYKNLKGVVEFTQEDVNNYHFKVTYGRMPDAYDEIAIPEYYAYCMLNWNYINSELVTPTKLSEIVNEEKPLTLTLGSTASRATYKIVGIVKTHNIDKKFNVLYKNYESNSTLLQNEYLNYINNGYFLYGFVKPGFINYCIKQYNTLTEYKSGFGYKIGGLSNTFTQFHNFNDLTNLTENYVFFNNSKTKLETNELMLDVSLFDKVYSQEIGELKQIASNTSEFSGYSEEIDYDFAQIKNKNRTAKEKIEHLNHAIGLLTEIQDKIDQVNNVTRKQSIFIKDVKIRKLDTSKSVAKEIKIPDGNFKVVGFYTGSTISASKSAVMTISSMQNIAINIQQGNYSSILATNLGNGKINVLSSIFMKDSGVTYSCQNNTIAMIKINRDFFQKLSYLFLIISALFALFSIAMFGNFISVSIRNKYNEIGILRALGARSVEILKMFVVESVTLALINAVVASIIGAFGCVFINFFLSKYLNFYIPIALFGIRQVLVIFGLSLLVAVISASRPIIKISKKKPVEIISRSL